MAHFPVVDDGRAVITEAVAHFRALAQGYAATLVIVTTAREAAEAAQHRGGNHTMTLVNGLAEGGSIVHLHYPD
ncbi:MAG: hypothetical protein ACRDTF_18735, partial [Pseudonocardiaceae bacterium]